MLNKNTQIKVSGVVSYVVRDKDGNVKKKGTMPIKPNLNKRGK